MTAASGISSLGDGIRVAAVPLLAVRLTSDPALVAAIAACGQLPWLAAPLLGVLIDRQRPMRLMMLCDVARTIVVGSLAVVIALGGASPWILAITAAALGTAAVLADSAAQVVVPHLVDESGLERGNARVFSAQAISAQMLGPMIGAWVAGVAIAIPFGLDAATFLASGVILASILPFDPPPPERSGGRVRHEMAEGVRWMFGDPLVRGLTSVVVGLSLLDGAVGGVLVLFAVDRLGLTSTGYGVLLALAAVGALIGAQSAPWMQRRWGGATVLRTSVVVAGLSYVGLAGTRSVVLAGILLGIHALGVMWWNVLTVSARQRAIPPDLLGRVTTLYRMAAWGATPIGTVLGGLLAAQVGLVAVIAGAGVGLVLLLLPVARLRGLPARI